jgi:hypothetical protein
MEKATIGSYLEMTSVIEFVIDTKTFYLEILLEKSIKNWSLKVFFHSDSEKESL